MKSFILIIFIIGIVFVTIGYMENYNKCPPPQIQYRYIPRSFYEEQVSSTNIRKFYSDIFNEPDTWSTYPFNENNTKYNRMNYKNFIEKNQQDN